jgi:hypothetical protein
MTLQGINYDSLIMRHIYKITKPFRLKWLCDFINIFDFQIQN